MLFCCDKRLTAKFEDIDGPSSGGFVAIRKKIQAIYSRTGCHDGGLGEILQVSVTML